MNDATARDVELLGVAPPPAVRVRPPKLAGQYIITNVDVFAQVWARTSRLEADPARQHAALGLMAVLRYDVLRWKSGVTPPELQTHRGFAEAVGVSRKLLFGRTRAVDDGPLPTSTHDPGLLDLLQRAGVWDPAGWHMPCWNLLRGDPDGTGRPAPGFEAISVQEFRARLANLRTNGGRSWLAALGAFDRLRFVFREWDGWVPASNAGLAKMFGVHRDTMRKWARQWEASGLLVREPHTQFGTCWRVPRWRQLNAWEDPDARHDLPLDQLLEQSIAKVISFPPRGTAAGTRDVPADTTSRPSPAPEGDVDQTNPPAPGQLPEVGTNVGAEVGLHSDDPRDDAGPQPSTGPADVGPRPPQQPDDVGPQPSAGSADDGLHSPAEVGPQAADGGHREDDVGPRAADVGPTPTRSDQGKRDLLDALPASSVDTPGLHPGDERATAEDPHPSPPSDGPSADAWQRVTAELATAARCTPQAAASVTRVLAGVLAQVHAPVAAHLAAIDGLRAVRRPDLLVELLAPRIAHHGAELAIAQLDRAELDLPADAAHLAARIIARRRAWVTTVLPLPTDPSPQVATAESSHPPEQPNDVPDELELARARLRRWELMAGCPLPRELAPAGVDHLDDDAVRELVARLGPLPAEHRRRVLTGQVPIDDP